MPSTDEPPLRVGVHLGHWEGTPHDVVGLARVAEEAGLDSVWVSETWGSDAVVLCAAIGAATTRIRVGAAVLQMPARTPSATAMAAITLDHLTGGRFSLGLGISGPRVSDGWHGVPFDAPLERTREYVSIVRAAIAREAPLVSEGPHYRVGRGAALKTNVHPLRPDLPIYLAAMGPRNVALAAEIADGWIPLFYSPEHHDVFEGPLAEGTARSTGRTLDVAPMVPVAAGKNFEECRERMRSLLAHYLGGMGPRGANFYNDLMRRYGYETAARRVQDAFLEGHRAEATAAVPDAFVDEVALLGDPPTMARRLRAYADAGVTSVLARTTDLDGVRAVARAAASLPAI